MAPPEAKAAAPAAEDKGYRPEVGEKIAVGKSVAICRFVGKTQFAHGEWVGAELADNSGKNDGQVQGVRYFDCPPGHGIFIKTSMCKKYEEPTSPNKADVDALGKQLAVATEDNDTAQLRELLPLAERKGVDGSELEVAQRAVTTQAQSDLAKELEQMRRAIASLTEAMSDVELRTAAVETVKAEGGQPDAAEVEAFVSHYAPSMKNRLVEGMKEDVTAILEKARAQAPAGGVTQPGASGQESAPGGGKRASAQISPEGGDTEEAAATRIQAAHRGRQSRSELDKKRQSAVRIQAVERGRQSRKHLNGDVVEEKKEPVGTLPSTCAREFYPMSLEGNLLAVAAISMPSLMF